MTLGTHKLAYYIVYNIKRWQWGKNASFCRILQQKNCKFYSFFCKFVMPSPLEKFNLQLSFLSSMFTTTPCSLRKKECIYYKVRMIPLDFLSNHLEDVRQLLNSNFYRLNHNVNNLPLVKRGSGSFLKKDFSKLLITFKSRHFYTFRRKGQTGFIFL